MCSALGRPHEARARPEGHRINWDAARAVCARQGGRLVILETIAEYLLDDVRIVH